VSSGGDDEGVDGQHRTTPLSQWQVFVVVSALVIGTDQAAKWVAWRQIDGALVNDGAYVLLGRAIRSWFAGPVSGAIANLVGAVAVVVGALLLLRRPRSTSTLIGSALVAAGWASNLLDRFGLHAWTAPGSGRGVVDFIPSGGTSRCNVADLWIVVGVMVLGCAAARNHLDRRRFQRPHPG
jgi:lipoprotein signal peptidase